MKKFSDAEIKAAQAVLAHLRAGETGPGIQRLETLKEGMYAAIPDKQRQSRGITWVLRRIGDLLSGLCETDKEIKSVALALHENLEDQDRLRGVAVFMMSDYGEKQPQEVLSFFSSVGDAEQWEVREFAAMGLRKLIRRHKDILRPWLEQAAASDRPNVQRMVSEALRPVADGRWLREEPDYSLGVLRRLFQEAHPYPRTSVGNNLSDLSKHHPELIFGVVQELIEMGDDNSRWIAHRACRNLVKAQPQRVLDVLGVDEYHYKDRHAYRRK